jgi:hypothetical protein
MAAARRPDERSAGDAELRRRQLKARNWALLAALVAFAVLVYIVAIVRMSGG